MPIRFCRTLPLLNGHTGPQIRHCVLQTSITAGRNASVLAGLERLADTSACDQLETLGRSLGRVPHDIPDVGPQRIGSMFRVIPGRQPDAIVRRPDCIPQDAIATHAHFFHAASTAGIHMPPSRYEVGFLSLAHRPEHIDALGDVLVQLQARSVDSDSVAANSRRTSSRK